MERVPDIKQTAIFDAPIEKVWKVVSTAEGISSWFMPNDFKAELGHHFYIQSQFGPSPCKVLSIDPPHQLSFAWDEDGWIVQFELKEIDGKTEFTLIHTGWKKPEDIVPKAGQPNAVIREFMNQGWEGLVHRSLRKVVEA